MTPFSSAAAGEAHDRIFSGADPRPPLSAPGPSSRNNFDMLRFIFAYAVVVYYTFYLTGHDQYVPGSVAGVAVAGFFVISGFLLTSSLTRQPELGAYAVKRAFRIYPLYGLVILIQAVVLIAEFDGPLSASQVSRSGTWAQISRS